MEIRREALATFWERTLAILIDAVLVATPVILITKLAPDNIEKPLAAIINTIYAIGSVAVYGKTLGKHLVGLKILSLKGKMDWQTATVRSLLPLVSTVSAYFGTATVFIGQLLSLADIIWYFTNPRRQTLHDLLAKTVVVKSKRMGGL